MKELIFLNARHTNKARNIFSLLASIFVLNHGYSQHFVGFDTTNWNTKSENIIDFDGRKCLSGEAELKDIFFANGTIEFDIWTDGSRSYPGVIFRDTGNGNFETIYVRPHRSGLYDDAVQYAPSFHNTVCWQLYHGPGYTSNALIQKERWNHVKVVVRNDRASLYLNEEEDSLLKIHLAHQPSAGKIRLNTSNNKTYISNFKLDPSNLEKTSENITEPENRTLWEISKLQDSDKFNIERIPGFYQDFYLGWQKVSSERNGLINISKYRNAAERKESCIYARRQIYAENDGRTKIAFGYSDAAKVFFNGTLIYSGDYAYQSRANSFTGTVGLFDTLYVDLHKGINELFVVSKDRFGGWGFYFNIEEKYSLPIADSGDSLVKQWTTSVSEIATESAAYDPVGQFVYYTHFDNTSKPNTLPTGYITKANLKGEVIEEKWIDNLNRPTGICLYRNKLYVVERESVAEISIAKGELIKRHKIPGQVNFPNDIASDQRGTFYITNSTTKNEEPDIFMLKNGRILPWITSEELSSLNGITYDQGNLYIGNSGKNQLQKIDVSSKTIATVTSFGSGSIDGIKIDKNGSLLVSLWRGELYRVNKSGETIRLLNSIGKYNIADFEYIEALDLIIIPTFLGKNIVAYKL